MGAPRLTWDFGTAYDFFVSLYVLHEPDKFGLRGVWAAGMRSRLPAAEREFLEEVEGTVTGPPLPWVYSLPAPKDAVTALRALGSIPAAERLPALVFCCSEGGLAEAKTVLLDVAARQAWDEQDLDSLREAIRPYVKEKGHDMPARKKLATELEWWSRSEEFGERYLKALAAYYEVFFAEEERRIAPALQDALARAQALAAELSIAELVEELSQGIRWEQALKKDELICAPSYWCAPLVFWDELGPGRMLMLFGARPDDAALIPGEAVPETLLRALKALSDPTRLKIMHYLTAESLTPTQLAHRLRLRPPTVIHHLQTLRVAGLVHVTVAEGKERSYAARRGAVYATCEALQRFLGEGLPEGETSA